MSAVAKHAAAPLRDEQAPRVDLCWRPRRDWGALPALRRAARHALAAEGFTHGALSVAVVGRRAMARLHWRHMAVRGPTDVLTFDLGTDRARGRIDGEVVVCADVARARAPRGGDRRGAAELALYVVHGILHLAGYDDHDAAGYQAMHAREDALLTQIGLGPVFQRAARET